MADGSASPLGDIRPYSQRMRIEIGLVNNMLDAALCATERQFASLIAAAGGGLDVRLRLFTLPGLSRGPAAVAAMAGRYQDVAALDAAGLDALIVTGAEPQTADLRDEAYWPQMARLIDWAEAKTISTLWSCLAAHAAVLHLDGINRQPLKEKCAGVFLCEQVADDPLVQGLSNMVRMPHSRRNALSAGDLVARGYHLLTHSREAGADLFVRRGRSLSVFFQGHPEYDADGLLKEYCRDVGRHLRGELDEPPLLPTGYFDTHTETAFRVLAAQARRDPNPALAARCFQIASEFRPPQPWRPHAEVIFRNWLGQIAVTKAARDLSAFHAQEQTRGNLTHNFNLC